MLGAVATPGRACPSDLRRVVLAEGARPPHLLRRLALTHCSRNLATFALPRRDVLRPVLEPAVARARGDDERHLRWFAMTALAEEPAPPW